jgi:hypothetical protein
LKNTWEKVQEMSRIRNMRTVIESLHNHHFIISHKMWRSWIVYAFRQVSTDCWCPFVAWGPQLNNLESNNPCS